jgi:hypothetical protein
VVSYDLPLIVPEQWLVGQEMSEDPVSIKMFLSFGLNSIGSRVRETRPVKSQTDVTLLREVSSTRTLPQELLPGVDEPFKV